MMEDVAAVSVGAAACGVTTLSGGAAGASGAGVTGRLAPLPEAVVSKGRK